jgi:PKD repeat protein
MSTRIMRKGQQWLFITIVALAGALLLGAAPQPRVGVSVAHAQVGQLQVSAGGPYSGLVGQPIFFSAQALIGGLPPTTTVQFQWNFGDGGMGFGQSTSHTFASAGTFTVTVFASTPSGQSGFASTTAQVGTSAQGQVQVSAGGPYSGQVGALISFTAQATIGGVLPSTPVQFQWSFGDGGAGFGQITTHAYAAVGTYTVIVTATTTLGQSGSATTVAQIGTTQAGQLAVSVGGPYVGQIGVPITFSAQVTVGFVQLGVGVQFQWSFGDGGTAIGQTASHVYTTAGTFTLTVSVTTSTGQSGSATTSVTVGGSSTTSTGTEQIVLYPSCNNVAVTWPSGTAISTVVVAISPVGSVIAVWRFDNLNQRFAGYSTALGAPNDLVTVNRGDPVFICMNSSGTLTRPVI